MRPTACREYPDLEHVILSIGPIWGGAGQVPAVRSEPGKYRDQDKGCAIYRSDDEVGDSPGAAERTACRTFQSDRPDRQHGRGQLAENPEFQQIDHRSGTLSFLNPVNGCCPSQSG